LHDTWQLIFTPVRAIGAVGITVPSVWYLLQPRASSHHEEHGAAHGGAHGEEAEEAEPEEESKDEPAPTESQDQTPGDQQVEEKSSEGESEDEGKSEESNEGKEEKPAEDAETKEPQSSSEGEKAQKPSDKQAAEEGKDATVKMGNTDDKGSNTGEKTEGKRESIPDAKGGFKKRVESGIGKELTDKSGSDTVSSAPQPRYVIARPNNSVELKLVEASRRFEHANEALNISS